MTLAQSADFIQVGAAVLISILFALFVSWLLLAGLLRLMKRFAK